MQLIFKFCLATTFVCLVSFQTAMAQMKTVEGKWGNNPSQETYTLKPKPNNLKEAVKASATLDFKNLPLAVPSPHAVLKAGILNDLGLPLFIEGKIEFASKGEVNKNVFLYLEEAKPLMKISDDNISFVITTTSTDDLGLHHVRLQQMYKNIPVFGGEIVIHGDETGFDFLNGNYFTVFNETNTNPEIIPEDAIQKVTNDFTQWAEIKEDMKKFLPGERIQNELVLYKGKQGNFTLAYHITAYPSLADRWEYFVDAVSGDIIEKYPSLCKFHGFGTQHFGKCDHNSLPLVAKSEEFMDGKAQATARDLLDVNRLINTYQVGSNFFLIDASRDMFSNASSLPNEPAGTIWTINAFDTSPAKSNFTYDHVTSSNNTWVNSRAGVSSHYNGGKAFEYFRIVHSRNSIDGQGGNIISFINVADEDGASMGNAFWNGAAMFYGNGDNAFFSLARGLDVAGHEMSHGVIQNTANLVYQGESGALNESFADIFGVMIDRDDWVIGEDVVRVNAFPSGALRSMSDPHNGAPTNNFAKGWQPKHYNERYQGNDDNGGVHINSGIPNHAFFLFASAVGKEKAERVFYRALTQYLTKSSVFVDCRVAVVKAATDLHGANSTEVNAAKKAFTDVGIVGDEGGSYENDAPQNPGQEFVLFTDQNRDGLYITNSAGQPVSFGNPLTLRSILSKPSISDDGSEIVYVGADNKLYYIFIDWNTLQKTETAIGSDPVWRNAIISKDGFKLAAVTEDLNNEIYVFDFSGSNVTSNTYELYNPTFTEGIITGDVLYADAMEFDITGEYIMYDAENEIESNSSGSISYWDIGFIKVWNNASNSFGLGDIDKLFSALPSNVSAGNPTFSKNSPYIIAFDYLEDDNNYLLGANLETGDVGTIFENNVLAYPTYSPKDNQMLFDNVDVVDYRIGRINLQANKIVSVQNTAVVWLEGFRWATWFSNGDRVLSDSEDPILEDATFFVFPNPADQNITIHFEHNEAANGVIRVYDVQGKFVMEQKSYLSPGKNEWTLPLPIIQNGTYFIKLMINGEVRGIKMVQVQK